MGRKEKLAGSFAVPSILLLAVDSVLPAALVTAPRITPAANGPYHVIGRHIVDAGGHPYLVRGTEMPGVTLKTEDFSGDGKEFGPFSASSFATVRERLNMNAVRLPVNAQLYEENANYRARVAQAVQEANRFELLVILASEREDDISFWVQCATQFRSNPNLFFAPQGRQGQALVDAIRSTGAKQPIVVAGAVRDASAIFAVTPHYRATRTGEDRWSPVWFSGGTGACFGQWTRS